MHYKFKLILSFFCCIGLCLQAAPQWWSGTDYQLIDTAKTENDDAVVLQGQGKQAFAASKSYFDDSFGQFGGAGEDIDTLFESSWFTTSTYDYYVLLNGQLKSLAHPFYVRFDELGIPLSLIGFSSDYTGEFPWTDNTSDNADYSPALIGQVKYVFSFDLSLSQDGDSIPDWWEYIFGTDPTVDTDNSTTDSDGDARFDSLEYAEKTDPTDYYDGTLPTLTIVSGDNQQVTAGTSAAEPVVIRVDKDAAFLPNAPLEISLAALNSGELSVGATSTVSNLSARTNIAGELAIDYSADSSYEGAVTIEILAQSGSHQIITVQAVLNVIRELSLSLFSGVSQTYIYDGTNISGAGHNESGQLAGQTDAAVDQFSEFSGLPAGIVKIATGVHHALALTASGDVYVWGDNFFGQLGLGDFQGRAAPALVPTLSNVIDISAGDGFSSFLIDDGDGTTTIYLSGNLRDGLKTDAELTNLPLAAGQSTHPEAMKLAASGRHLLILCTDGSVWGWGQNTFGQVSPAFVDSYLPVATLIIDSNVVAITTSPDNSLAITSTGELQAWGNTAFDQLESGILDPETGVYTLGQGVAHATLGNGFIAYLDGSDVLMTAGLNDSGQLGRDTGTQTVSSAALVTRPVSDPIVTFVSGDRYLVYLTDTDEFYGFGDNSQGALGVGAVEQLNSPTLLTPNLN
jgi:alpha-tubulin suppressor-like RCC1 family protein